MSIATSALITPSKAIRWLLLFMTCCASVAWGLVIYWFLSRHNYLIASLQLLVATLLYCFALRVVFNVLQQKFVVSLEISGEGDILLRRLNAAGQVVNSDSVKLRSPLILWPSLLLLSLQNESGKTTHLLILRDNVSATGFRRLSLAFHWLAQAQTSVSVQNDLSEGNF